jgi:hypothetical protein
MTAQDTTSGFARPSRRNVIGAGLKAAGALGVLAGSARAVTPALATPLDAGPATDSGRPIGADIASLGRAYQFLDAMMDAYAQGMTPRLAQSYSDQIGLQTTAFTYDNALQIIALLESSPFVVALLHRQSQNLARATLLGDSLLYAQQHDPTYTDGRLRDAYFTNPFVLQNGTVNLAGNPFFFTGSAVGNMAWAGLALVHLYRATGKQQYLTGALQLGRWIVLNAYAAQGLGGYTGGVDGNNNRFTYKSTEHNIDVYALFSLLARLTGDQWYPPPISALSTRERSPRRDQAPRAFCMVFANGRLREPFFGPPQRRSCRPAA